MKAVVVALLMLAAPAWAADWELNHESAQRGEVTTYVREVSDSPVKAFKGVVELQTSATSVLAVITAVDTFEEWIFQSQGADRLSIKEKERIHMRFNGIWPVADRPPPGRGAGALPILTGHGRGAAGRVDRAECPRSCRACTGTGLTMATSR